MAVLLVVLGHAGVWFLPGGFVGVDVFFVLSGFLITSLLLAEVRARGSVSLLEFYIRRARRILPAAALTLVVTDVAAFFLLNFLRARDAVHDSLAAAVFTSNFRFAAHDVDYFARADPPSPLLHYWSLSVEEQFYFVWPLLLSLALCGVAVKRRSRPAGRRHGRRLLVVVVALTVASLAWSIHATATLPAAAYFSPLTRAWELGIGATLAVAASTVGRAPPVARVVMGWTGMLAIAYAAVVHSESTPFPGSAALVPTVGTALAIAAGMGDRSRLAVARLLEVRPMGIVGDRSYAFYLWHWPVLVLAAQYVGHELSVPVKLGLMMGAFLLSCVSYTLVENPMRRGIRSRTATGIVVAVCTAAVLSTAAASLAAIDRKQQRFEAPVAGVGIAPGGLAGSGSSARGSALPAVVAAVEAARRNAPIPSGLVTPISQLRRIPPQYAVPGGCIGQNGRTATTSAICRIGDRSSRRVIVLLGDSHADMWLPALLEMAWRDHWAVVPLVRLGCTPGWWITGDRSASCRQWYDWALRQIRRLRPRVTLLAGSIGERPSPAVRAATSGVIAAARALKPLGPVVVVGDPEGLRQDPIDCLLSRRASMARCTTTWPRASLEAYDNVDRATKQLGVGFLRTRGFACYQRQCPAVVGRMIAWRDNNHLGAVYSAELADAFRAGFLRAAAQAPR